MAFAAGLGFLNLIHVIPAILGPDYSWLSPKNRWALALPAPWPPTQLPHYCPKEIPAWLGASTPRHVFHQQLTALSYTII